MPNGKERRAMKVEGCVEGKKKKSRKGEEMRKLGGVSGVERGDGVGEYYKGEDERVKRDEE